jgi:hypothetical protein
VAPEPVSRRAPTPFRDTNRYVRGRVLASLRDAPVGAWVTLDPEVLAIEAHRVVRAARELRADGLIDLAAGTTGRLEARLRDA